MKKFERNQLARAVSLTLTGSAVAAMIMAPTQAQAQNDSSFVLEEIIVTAQKREQNLQDVADKTDRGDLQVALGNATDLLDHDPRLAEEQAHEILKVYPDTAEAKRGVNSHG